MNENSYAKKNNLNIVRRSILDKIRNDENLSISFLSAAKKPTKNFLELESLNNFSVSSMKMYPSGITVNRPRIHQ